MSAATYSNRARTRGVALITAIMITALAAIIATNLAWDNALDVRRTMMLLNRDQAVQVALGAESWVATILSQDLADSDTDHLEEIWAIALPGLPIDGGEVFGVIEDLQGRFNINNLLDQNGVVDPQSSAMEQFRRLLDSLGLDPRFAGLAGDWLDTNTVAALQDGAEDGIYTGMLPPYRSANQMLTSVSELAALDGMDKQSFDILKPHIAALPGRMEINVNTATAAVLQSLDESMTPGDVEGLMTQRESGGFSDVDAAFSSRVTDQDVLLMLAETTQYFRLKVIVRIDTVRITLYSVLYRELNGSVTPILRSFGTT